MGTRWRRVLAWFLEEDRQQRRSQLDPPDQGCYLPPVGLYCTLPRGHDGPCDLRKDVSRDY
jgi:hypothetical protein